MHRAEYKIIGGHCLQWLISLQLQWPLCMHSFNFCKLSVLSFSTHNTESNQISEKPFKFPFAWSMCPINPWKILQSGRMSHFATWFYGSHSPNVSLHSWAFYFWVLWKVLTFKLWVEWFWFVRVFLVMSNFFKSCSNAYNKWIVKK